MSMSRTELPRLPSPAERRRGRRRRLASREVRLGCAGSAEAARCEDISDGGMRLRLQAPLQVGDDIGVVFNATSRVAGRVIWVSGDECGVAFGQWLDSVLFLYNTAGHCEVPAPACPSLSASGVTAPVAGFHAGLRMKFILPSGESRPAVVHWTSAEEVTFQLIAEAGEA
jgi:hypothetical protein